MFNVILPRFGVTTTYVDGRDVNAFKKVITPNTTLIYLESPNSFTYELQDLEAVAVLARQHHILTHYRQQLLHALVSAAHCSWY